METMDKFSEYGSCAFPQDIIDVLSNKGTTHFTPAITCRTVSVESQSLLKGEASYSTVEMTIKEGLKLEKDNDENNAF